MCDCEIYLLLIIICSNIIKEKLWPDACKRGD